ncbi:MAG: asparagine--tRNA ligase [Deltaproteobacteria bacterium]|nr:asparagine--tRNA ligase [Deltaproteobacteria bacterium]
MNTIKTILENGNSGDNLTVKGWVQTSRTGKSVSFIELSDGSTIKTLQIVLNPDLENYDDVIRHALTGSAVIATGVLIDSPAAGQQFELTAKSVVIAGSVDPDYPLQKKRHSFEFLRTIGHLRPRTRTFGAVFRVRHALQMAVHNFFDSEGFIMVHTPIITGSDCEGAGQMFRVSTLDPANIPLNADKSVDYSKDFFEKEAALTVSGQLEGEIFALAFKNIYTFGPTFRAENSHTARHAAEFWMIEPEMAFCDLQKDMNTAQKFIKYIVKYVLDRCSDDIDFFDQRVEKGLRNKLESIVNSDFETLTYTDAVNALQNSGKNFSYPVKWGLDLQSEHERYITEELVKKPTFIIDYPRDIKAFYMRLNSDEKTVAAMDLLVPFVGEIIGGSQREERIEMLDNQLAHFSLNKDDYWWYRDLRRFGGVPHAGFGLGFERALMYVTGMQNIRDVIPFARTAGSADF